LPLAEDRSLYDKSRAQNRGTDMNTSGMHSHTNKAVHFQKCQYECLLKESSSARN